MKERIITPAKRIFAIIISVMITMSCMPSINVWADDESSKTIDSFMDYTSEYTVDFGTAIEDAGLPEELSANVTTKTDEDESTSVEKVSVEWSGEYNKDVAGTYTLAATISDEYELNCDIPTATVTVKAEADEAEVAETASVAEYNEKKYESLSDAVNAAVENGGGTVTLLKNTTDAISVNKSVNLIIDLNGKTLTSSSDSIAMSFKNGVTGLVKNGTITGGLNKDGSAIYAYNCGLSFDAITITGNASKFNGHYAVKILSSVGNQTINNCSFSNNEQGALSVSVGADATLDVTNSDIKDNTPQASFQVISKGGNGKVTFDKCTITGNNTKTGYLINLLGNTDINNSIITGNTGSGIYLYSYSNTNYNFNNTSITGNTSVGEYEYYASGINASSGANVYVTGGALYGNTYNNGECKGDIYVSSTSSARNISVDSSVDMGDSDIWYEEIEGSVYETLDLSTTSKQLIYATTTEDIPGVVSIEDTKYLSLEDALSDAKNGDIIKILTLDNGTARAISTTDQIDWPEGVTLDLNGNTYSGSNWFCVWDENISIINSSERTGTFNSLIYVYGDDDNNGTLTIGDNVNTAKQIYYYGGKITVSGSHKSMSFLMKNGSLPIYASEDFSATSLNISYADDTLDIYNDNETEVEDLLIVSGKSKMKDSKVTVSNLTNTLAEIMKNDDGDIVVHKTVAKGIYIDGVNGNDENDALTESTPIKTFDKAKEILLSLQEEDSSYNAIYVLNTITVSDEETFDLNDEGNILIRDKSNKNALINIKSGGDLTLKNITINGNRSSVTKAESMITVTEGNLTIEDGVILTSNDVSGASYPAWKGGAITVLTKGTAVMNGGVIRNCIANNGGGIFVRGKLIVNDGLFEKNEALTSSGTSEYGCGGAIASTEHGEIELNGGMLKDNTAEWDGGAISVGIRRVFTTDEPLLTMNGGVIDGNTANNTGGGIFVQGGSVARVSAGEITNNDAKGVYASYVGGGIYVNGVNAKYIEAGYKNGVLYITNALITDNYGTSGGSGIGSCPTSNLELYVTNGAAIADNEGDEIHISNKTEYGSATHYGNPDLFLSGRMLGGSLNNWDITNNTTDLTLEDIVDHKVKVYGTLDFENNPSGSYMELAKSSAKVVVTGNTANGYGGGIGSNGNVIVGTNDETTEISGKKTWNDNDDIRGKRPESITVNLYSNGILAESKVVTADDNWEYTFSDLPETLNGEKIEYTITEDAVSNYEAEYNGYDITNTYVNKVSIGVKKLWDDNNAESRPDSITVKLYANGEFTGDELTLTSDMGWKGSFDNLDDLTADGEKIVYTIEEVSVDGYTTTIEGSMEEGFTITNQLIPENPPEEDEEEPPASPKTGDESMMILWIGTLAAGVMCLVYIIRRRKIKKS